MSIYSFIDKHMGSIKCYDQRALENLQKIVHHLCLLYSEKLSSIMADSIAKLIALQALELESFSGLSSICIQIISSRKLMANYFRTRIKNI